MKFEDSKLVYINSIIKQRRVVEGVLINSIPTLAGNKSFNTLDKMNTKHVIRESNLLSFVRAANNSDMSLELNCHRPNPPDPGLTTDQQMSVELNCHSPNPPNLGLTTDEQMGRITTINDQGQIVGN